MLTDEANAARSVSRPAVICCRAMIFGSSAAEVLKHGLEPGLEPPDPVEADPVTIPAAQREQRGIRRLPPTQQPALDALEADAILTGALGSVLARSCLTVRRSEWDAYNGEDHEVEQQGHFLKY